MALGKPVFRLEQYGNLSGFLQYDSLCKRLKAGAVRMEDAWRQLNGQKNL
jgi:hypothetical protein